MSAKRSRAVRAGIEGLERRETPSNHALATLPTVLSIAGSGNGLVTQADPGVNGHAVTYTIHGRGLQVGKYGGELNIFLGNPLTSGPGNGVITSAATGDQIDLSLKATTGHPNETPSNPGIIRFTVVGGTGAFANASGSGTLVGHLSIIRSFSFVTTGLIRE